MAIDNYSDNQCRDADYCPTEIRELIGTRSDLPPASVIEPEDSSCDNCWTEPYIAPENNVMGNGLAATSFLASSIQNIIANSGKPKIFVYLNYNQYKNGTTNVSSVSVDNQTAADLSITKVYFMASMGPTNCKDACLSGNNKTYVINPGPGLKSSNDTSTYGISPMASAGKITTVNLNPSGYNYNPDNTFYPNSHVTISVNMVYTATGIKNIPITYQFK